VCSVHDWGPLKGIRHPLVGFDWEKEEEERHLMVPY